MTWFRTSHKLQFYSNTLTVTNRLQIDYNYAENNCICFDHPSRFQYGYRIQVSIWIYFSNFLTLRIFHFFSLLVGENSNKTETQHSFQIRCGQCCIHTKIIEYALKRTWFYENNRATIHVCSKFDTFLLFCKIFITYCAQ